MCAFLLDSCPHGVMENCMNLEEIAKTHACEVCCASVACVCPGWRAMPPRAGVSVLVLVVECV